MVKKNVMLFLLLIAVAALICTLPTASLAAKSKAAATDTPAKITSPESPQSASAKININTASAAELEKLPGVGPKTAKMIVEQREANGPFKSLEDLQRVKGLSTKKIDKLRDKATVE